MQIADTLKSFPIDGVRYISHYTTHNNIAIWKYEELNFDFVGSEIYYLNSEQKFIRLEDNLEIGEFRTILDFDD